MSQSSAISKLDGVALGGTCQLSDNKLKTSSNNTLTFPASGGTLATTDDVANAAAGSSATVADSDYTNLLTLNTTNFKADKSYVRFGGCGRMRTLQLKLTPKTRLQENGWHQITTNYYVHDSDISTQERIYLPCLIAFYNNDINTIPTNYHDAYIIIGDGWNRDEVGILIGGISTTFEANITFYASVSFYIMDGYTENFES